jgi:hypothetical protein
MCRSRLGCDAVPRTAQRTVTLTLTLVLLLLIMGKLKRCQRRGCWVRGVFSAFYRPLMTVAVVLQRW